MLPESLPEVSGANVALSFQGGAGGTRASYGFPVPKGHGYVAGVCQPPDKRVTKKHCALKGRGLNCSAAFQGGACERLSRVLRQGFSLN